MNRTRVGFLGVLSSLVFAACQIAPQPNSHQNVGKLELGFGNTLGVQAAVYNNGNNLVFTPDAAALVCDDAQSGLRYIYRRFTVTNNTASTLTNLQLHAYAKTGNASGTAIKSVVDFGGNAANASQAFPRHGIGATCGTSIPLVPTADYADLQLYTTNERTTREGLAGTDLVSGEKLLGYGYLVRQRSGQTNADSDDRSLASGESGKVTLALKVPLGAASSYNFVMTFLLYTDTAVKELVQTPEDQYAGTTAGLSNLPSGTARVSVLGGAACGLTGSNRFQSSYAMAYQSAADVTEPDLTAPSIATTITSNANTGTGSLRAAIAAATAGDALCFTQNITLTTGELAINKNLSILSGENLFISGNNASRVLNISSGNVKLYGFTVRNGSNAQGAGISNAGTLTLRGMTISNNVALGANGINGKVDPAGFTVDPAYPGSSGLGGGIYSSGAVNANFSQIKSNSAQGGNGGIPASDPSGNAYNDYPISNGTNGGAANGGGVYLSNATLTLVGTSVTNNNSKGGNASNGLNYNITNPINCAGDDGKGGNGGNASGGGVFKGGTSTVNGSGLVSANTALGGSKGFGGFSSGNCASQGTNVNGTDGTPNPSSTNNVSP
jgi:hypothetical protein